MGGEGGQIILDNKTIKIPTNVAMSSRFTIPYSCMVTSFRLKVFLRD